MEAISVIAESGYNRDDADGDGLDITDATKIQRYLVEFADLYHIGEYVIDNTKPTQDEYELPFIPNYNFNSWK